MFLIYLALTYLLASTLFALVITTLHGGEQDVRTFGSGNIGATNVARLYGWSLAPLKGCWTCSRVGSLWRWRAGSGPIRGSGRRPWSRWWRSSGTVFPIYLEFRGGKGVATGAGALLPIVPTTILSALVTWALC